MWLLIAWLDPKLIPSIHMSINFKIINSSALHNNNNIVKKWNNEKKLVTKKWFFLLNKSIKITPLTFSTLVEFDQSAVLDKPILTHLFWPLFFYHHFLLSICSNFLSMLGNNVFGKKLMPHLKVLLLYY
jgi:hypothetical protein